MAMTSEALEALLAAPVLEPPAGVTANFDNPPNRNGLAWRLQLSAWWLRHYVSFFAPTPVCGLRGKCAPRKVESYYSKLMSIFAGNFTDNNQS